MPEINRPIPYNPLDKRNLGVSVADALLASEVSPLPPRNSMSGAGIYAIYYTGKFPPYAPIAKRNAKDAFTLPIYVGKAIPEGGRRGGSFDDYEGMALYNRLKEHAESIAQTNNLQSEDFHCRYLVVEDIWIPLGETLLINMFSPLWNISIDGFGNHDPGSGRHQQKMSPWDALHTGRTWASRLQPSNLTLQEIKQRIADYCAALPRSPTPDK